ncbi:MAG: hypothetical protein FWC15_05670 [Fibromonadales bacterium]|nr:hypothetical protein [Fibromonadales bacterium]
MTLFPHALSSFQSAFFTFMFIIAITHSGFLKFLAELKNIGRKIRRQWLRNAAHPFFFLAIRQNLVQESGAGSVFMLKTPNFNLFPFEATSL